MVEKLNVKTLIFCILLLPLFLFCARFHYFISRPVKFFSFTHTAFKVLLRFMPLVCYKSYIECHYSPLVTVILSVCLFVPNLLYLFPSIFCDFDSFSSSFTQGHTSCLLLLLSNPIILSFLFCPSLSIYLFLPSFFSFLHSFPIYIYLFIYLFLPSFLSFFLSFLFSSIGNSC